ncbi:hypothetical protein CBR_g22271 [Chara braunii]|uniref:FAD/NAD(P)-binding domain-containing protein n=1 Tax=Chara braunii TaxID=69332 RepID=A0A388L2U4_CHABU|nr:hypothetical protein CBR_g22271 [Chara braunii]|eukprot:GBG76523.1 hypothetical protein CBR_g22271 [Chara braunii]
MPAIVIPGPPIAVSPIKCRILSRCTLYWNGGKAGVEWTRHRKRFHQILVLPALIVGCEASLASLDLSTSSCPRAPLLNRSFSSSSSSVPCAASPAASSVLDPPPPLPPCPPCPSSSSASVVKVVAEGEKVIVKGGAERREMDETGGKGRDTKEKDLVLLGGGHSHVHVLKCLGERPIPGVRLTVVTRDVRTPYSGMLPGFVAGHYTYDDCHVDLAPLSRLANARLIHAAAEGIDVQSKLVKIPGGELIRYDVLAIDIGSRPVQEKVPGAREHSIPVKPIDQFSVKWEEMRKRVLDQAIMAQSSTSSSSSRDPPDGAAAASGDGDGSRSTSSPSPRVTVTIAVVGGGASGVEVTLAVQHRLMKDLEEVRRKRSQREKKGQEEEGGKGGGGEWREVEVKLRLHTGKALLPSYPKKMRSIFVRILGERGVELVQGSTVVEMGKGWMKGSDGVEYKFDECLWCTEGGAAPFLRETGLELDDQGFIKVDEYLMSTNVPDVFATGDIHSSVKYPRPKAGVFAVRQGPPLVENLRRRFAAIKENVPKKDDERQASARQGLRPFVPQSRFLTLVSTGNKYAVGARGSFVLEGGWVWWLKDKIDRKWMNTYNIKG